MLIENSFWNTAINRMYYACFYSVCALLASQNIDASTHAGVRRQFGQLLVKTRKIDKILARHFTNMFEKRHKGDYNDFFDFDETTVKELFPISKKFIGKIEEIINEQIKIEK
ncbi:MAG: HEPN domain-containing protein [Paludibacter sp.]|nr:HEPN domain-containing protein [Paludibacter sp.]